LSAARSSRSFLSSSRTDWLSIKLKRSLESRAAGTLLRLTIVVDVGIGGDLAVLIREPGKVDESHRNDLRERDGIRLPQRDHATDFLFRNPKRPGGQRARPPPPRPAVAPGPLAAVEEPFLIRGMQVDELAIVEGEHHPAEPVLGAWRH